MKILEAREELKQELKRYKEYATYLERENRKLEKEIRRVCSRNFRTLEPGYGCIGCVYCHSEDLVNFVCKRPLSCYVEREAMP